MVGKGSRPPNPSDPSTLPTLPVHEGSPPRGREPTPPTVTTAVGVILDTLPSKPSECPRYRLRRDPTDLSPNTYIHQHVWFRPTLQPLDNSANGVAMALSPLKTMARLLLFAGTNIATYRVILDVSRAE